MPIRPGSLRDKTDQDVVALAKEGEEEAYRELIRRYERPVFSLIFRMVRNRELAEDLSQETFVKVLNAVQSYRPEFKFSSWVFKIANNAAIDHIRKRELDTLSLEGSPHADTPELIEATALQISERGESQLDEVANRELGGTIERAIEVLRPEYRACIMLRHVEGRTYEEIAEILNLPLGTVKTYIHRARNELRILLREVKDE
ncbi:MAG: sigma-70 family RNA polymerase sigma factor [Gemmatimonadetes bacterium]|nr:sigma-70 family RNA polymerase sigma factor [Gemmatimonadota bacterium]